MATLTSLLTGLLGEKYVCTFGLEYRGVLVYIELERISKKEKNAQSIYNIT